MLNNRTLTKIAKYMEACGNYQFGKCPGLSGIELNGEFKTYLADEGMFDEKTGRYSASLIHAFLYGKNRKALVARCGKETVEAEMCPNEIEPMEDGESDVDISEKNRKEWLANLYEVCRCYTYQISEGNYQSDEFYWKMREWVGKMAEVLADYVVREFRPLPPNPKYRPWDEF